MDYSQTPPKDLESKGAQKLDCFRMNWAGCLGLEIKASDHSLNSLDLLGNFLGLLDFLILLGLLGVMVPITMVPVVDDQLLAERERDRGDGEQQLGSATRIEGKKKAWRFIPSLTA